MKKHTIMSCVVLPALLVSGCATVKSPPKPDPVYAAGSPSIRMDQEVIHFGKGFGREQRLALKSFLATVNRLVPARSIPSDTSACVRDVRIDISCDRSSAGQVVLTIASTVIPFLAFVPGRRGAEYSIIYTLEDAQGKRSSFAFRDTLSGAYYGWSFTRVSAAGKLQRAQRRQAAQNAAKLLVQDLCCQRKGAPLAFQRVSEPAALPPVVPRVRPARPVRAVSAGVPAAALPPLCAIITFEAKAGVGRDDVVRLRDKLEDEFGKRTEYEVSERLDMPQVLRAGALTPASSMDVAIETGKALKVQYVIYGAVSKSGNRITVDAYLVNVDKGVTESKVSLDGQGENAQVLLDTMGEVAKSLSGKVKERHIQSLKKSEPGKDKK